MNKSQLVEQLATGADISKAAAGRFLEAFIQTITDALKVGDQVMLIGFGTFVVRHRPARTGRDPRGNTIAIAATNVTSFRAAKALKDHLN